ncbi:MAG TPA: hypothetical protein VFI31_06205 [Pirellulales bacterium]|nr:hypothetical protein [Pirellulales bacterium]
MTAEVWLRPNRRILAVAALLPGLAFAAGCGLLLFAWGDESRRWLLATGAVAAAVSLAGVAFLLWQASLPRLGYDGRHLEVYLGTAKPVRVPIEVVEGFLLGRGPSFLPGRQQQQTEVANLVVRLAERAGEWERVEVNRQFGTWCGHYITIRGTWCERLSVALVNRLNTRLAEAQQALKHEAAR